MMDRAVETSPGMWARIAGAFYLITIIMGVFAEAFVRGALVVGDDAAATATNILAHEPLYRFGLAADLIMIACYIAVTLLFYGLFKPVSRSLSLLAAFFSLVGLAILAANCLNHLAFGVLYTVIILITMWNWALYIFWGVIEVVLTALIVWYA
jgi:uncharacterized protein DUF4386